MICSIPLLQAHATGYSALDLKPQPFVLSPFRKPIQPGTLHLASTLSLSLKTLNMMAMAMATMTMISTTMAMIMTIPMTMVMFTMMAMTTMAL